MGAKSTRNTTQNNRSDGHLLEYFRKSFARGGGGTNFVPPITATGGTVTTAGGKTIHTFTALGTFTVTGGSGNVEYLVVAGGGAGGEDVGGGGGGGGFRTNVTGHPLSSGTPFSVTPGPYSITVGAGGVGTGGIPTPAATDGGNSVFSTITSTGGGGGGNYNQGAGRPGGSGGGGSSYTGSYPAGAGNTPATPVSQGNPGGAGHPSGQGGGGGGAGGVGPGGGGDPSGFTPGGVGSPITISGSAVTYAAGGRGAGDLAPGPGAGSPGTGNGGDGAGASPNTGANGGSGIVIISYPT